MLYKLQRPIYLIGGSIQFSQYILYTYSFILSSKSSSTDAVLESLAHYRFVSPFAQIWREGVPKLLGCFIPPLLNGKGYLCSIMNNKAKIIRIRLGLGNIFIPLHLNLRLGLHTRLLSSWPLGKILTGSVHLRVTLYTLSGYPELGVADILSNPYWRTMFWDFA